MLPQRDPPGIREIKPTQHVEDSRFARPVGANEAGDLPRPYGEVDLSHRPDAAEGQGESRDLERLTMCALSQPGQNLETIGGPQGPAWTT